MECKICGNEYIEVSYSGRIRDGRVGNYTKKEYKLYKCKTCHTLWHEYKKDLKTYYESEEYRQSLEGSSDIKEFYNIHDAESMDKFKYTGTEVFREKIVADIGCGGGAFLDYIYFVAKKVIAIEPFLTYQNEMKNKGFTVYSYAKDALKEWKNKIDVIISFDCIEHVEDPTLFLKEVYDLLSDGGIAFIGTPTEAPVMRELLGEVYDSFLFSTQHLWVLNEKSFETIAKNLDIKNYLVKYYQRYGLGNCIYWLVNKRPGKHFKYSFISNSMEELWKNELQSKGLSDYIVFEVRK